MSNDARLTAEQVEEWRRFGNNTDMPDEEHESWNALCDMALRSLSEGGEPVGVVAESNSFGMNVSWSVPFSELPRGMKLYAAPPQGEWVSVPREPTPEMCAAGFSVDESEHDPAGVYRAMLCAAPKDGGK